MISYSLTQQRVGKRLILRQNFAHLVAVVRRVSFEGFEITEKIPGEIKNRAAGH